MDRIRPLPKSRFLAGRVWNRIEVLSGKRHYCRLVQEEDSMTLQSPVSHLQIFLHEVTRPLQTALNYPNDNTSRYVHSRISHWHASRTAPVNPSTNRLLLLSPPQFLFPGCC